jgi:hypothetical protein
MVSIWKRKSFWFILGRGNWVSCKFHSFDSKHNVSSFIFEEYNTIYYNYDRNIWIFASVISEDILDSYTNILLKTDFIIWSRKKKLERINV